MKDDENREPAFNAAESETLSMLGNSMRENRETSETPMPPGARDGRRRLSRTADMHVSEESDDLVVPTKRANKAGPMAAAEPVEGRGSTKGNVCRCVSRRTQSRTQWAAPQTYGTAASCGSFARPKVGAV